MTFTTIIEAIDPIDKVLKTWAGPNIESENWLMAEMYLVNNGLGYCKIDGYFIEEQWVMSKEQLN
jgi:hypothetical protein